jgi:hypothetical protein
LIIGFLEYASSNCFLKIPRSSIAQARGKSRVLKINFPSVLGGEITRANPRIIASLNFFLGRGIGYIMLREAFQLCNNILSFKKIIRILGSWVKVEHVI